MVQEPAFDGTPLLEALRGIHETRWSGVLRVQRDAQQLGAIVVLAGRIGWLVSKEQREDLGSFLFRIGKLTPEQLMVARRRYSEHDGAKKLGVVLEEEGLVSQQVLRNCLLLHLRSGLLQMLGDRRLTVAASSKSLQVDEQRTFSIDEILSPRESEQDVEARLGIFGDLASIPGYRATIVALAAGPPLLIHSAHDEASHGLRAADLPLDWLRSSRDFGARSPLGMTELAYFELEGGSIVASWVGVERSVLVAVYLESAGKLGLVKHRLAALSHAIETYAASVQRILNGSRVG